MILICGDVLRWYDPAAARHNAIGGALRLHWAVCFPVDTNLAGRTFHGGRFHIYLVFYYEKEVPVKLCAGTSSDPGMVLDSAVISVSDSGFYEVPFRDTTVLNLETPSGCSAI